MPKKPDKAPTPPFYLKQLKSGQWTVFDRQQRMHGGAHADKAVAEAALQRLLAEHRKGADPCRPAP